MVKTDKFPGWCLSHEARLSTIHGMLSFPTSDELPLKAKQHLTDGCRIMISLDQQSAFWSFI